MTLVEEIYDIFFSQIDDEMIAVLRPHFLRRLLKNYLFGSISKFDVCKNDLTVQGLENFQFTLEAGETEFKLPEGYEYEYFDPEFCMEIPKGLEVFGSESGKEYKNGIDFDLTLDEDGKSTKLALRESLEESIDIYLYCNGYFESDLIEEEKYILAYGMVIYWLRPHLYRETNTRNLITDSSYNQNSNANLLDKLQNLLKTTIYEHKIEIVDYSYIGFKGFN